MPTIREIVSSPGYFQQSTDDKMKALGAADNLPTGQDVSALVQTFDTAPEFAELRPQAAPAQQELPQLGDEEEEGFLSQTFSRFNVLRQIMTPMLMEEFPELDVTRPMLSVGQTAERVIGKPESSIGKVAGGVVIGTAKMIEEFSSPAALALATGGTALLAVKYVGTLILAGFSLNMAVGAAQQVPGVREALEDDDLQLAAERATMAIETGALALGAGFGAGFRVARPKAATPKVEPKFEFAKRSRGAEGLPEIGSAKAAPPKAVKPGPEIPALKAEAPAPVTKKIVEPLKDPATDPAVLAEPKAEVPATEVKDFIFKSIDALDIPQSGKAQINQIMLENEGFLAQRRGTQTWEQTKKKAATIAADLDIKPGTILNAEEAQALGETVAGLQLRNEQIGTKAREFIAQDKDIPLDIQAEWFESTQNLTAAVETMAGNTTEVGRALNSLRILKKAREGTEVDRLLKIRAQLQKQGMTPAKIQETIGRLAQFAPDDVLGRVNFLRDQQKPGFRDLISWYYMNNLLSNPKTHQRNIIGTGWSILTYFPANWTKALANTVTRKPIKNRNVFFGEFPHQVIGMLEGFQSGSQKALHMMKNGFSFDEVQMFDLPRVEIGRTPATRAVLNVIPRALNAMDLMMKSIVYEAEIKGSAYALAKKSGLEGNAMLTEYTRLSQNPSPAMVKQASSIATRIVFRDDPGFLSQKVIDVKRKWQTIPGLGKVPVIDFLVPFVRTPAAIMRRGAEAGPLFPILRSVPGGKLSRLKGRELDQAQGLAMFGTLSLYPMVSMAMSGRLTGDGPKDLNRRSALMDTGWQRNSMKIPLPDSIGERMGGKRSSERADWVGPGWGEYYVSYNLLQPLSFSAGFVANMWESFIYEDEAPTAVKIANGVAEGITGLANQSYLQGVTGLQEYLQDPERNLERFMGQFLSGFVPLSALQKGAALAEEPVIKVPRGISERLQYGTPFTNDNLLPRVDIFGEPLERVGNTVTRAFVVPQVSPVKGDRVRAELNRLELFPAVPGAPTVQPDGRELSREEILWISQLKGRSIRPQWEELLRDPVYKEASDDDKRTALTRTSSRVSTAITNAAKPGLALFPASVSTDDDKLRWTQMFHEESVKLMRPWFTEKKRIEGLKEIMLENPTLALQMLGELSQKAAENTNKRGGF